MQNPSNRGCVFSRLLFVMARAIKKSRNHKGDVIIVRSLSDLATSPVDCTDRVIARQTRDAVSVSGRRTLHVREYRQEVGHARGHEC
jgi:hypothetical protein